MIEISTADAVLLLLGMIAVGLVGVIAMERLTGRFRDTAVDGSMPFLGWGAACVIGIVAIGLWDFFTHVRIEWLP